MRYFVQCNVIQLVHFVVVVLYFTGKCTVCNAVDCRAHAQKSFDTTSSNLILQISNIFFILASNNCEFMRWYTKATGNEIAKCFCIYTKCPNVHKLHTKRKKKGRKKTIEISALMFDFFPLFFSLLDTTDTPY